MCSERSPYCKASCSISVWTGEGDTADGSMSLKYNTCLGVCPHAPAVSLDHDVVGHISLDRAVRWVDAVRSSDQAAGGEPGTVA